MSFRQPVFPFIVFFFFFIGFGFYASAQSEAAVAEKIGENILKGEKLFKANCTSCHKVEKKLIGPALVGAEGRWQESEDFDGVSGREWMNKWVRNSQEVVKAGYPRAVKLFGEYNKSVMTAFPQLTDADINDILDYVEYAAVNQPAATAAAGNAAETAAEGNTGSNLYLYALVGVLLIIVLILGWITSSLKKLVYVKEGIPIPVPVPVYKNKKIIATLALVFIIYIGYTTVNSAIDLGRQQGYMPDQPIKFSHQLHAGINKIDCQYCHTGAAKGKQSTIPSLNICMNCHKGVQEGTINGKYGRKEITKIYAAIGFNPATLSYINDYQNMPVDSAKNIFTAWLNDDAARKYSAGDVEEVLQHVQKPMEWVRIHNLPDHVYFNHSQHVTVAGLACQTCHGPVEEMEELYQFAPLAMRWCISCHRENEINFASNDYYQTFGKFHEDLKSGKISKVTVENIGGTECQKCHY